LLNLACIDQSEDEQASEILRLLRKYCHFLEYGCCSLYLSAMLSSLDQWFVNEVLPYEGVLMRYLARSWHNESELTDLRQEIYVRVYESARDNLPTHPKAVLFASARNLIIDRVRRQRVVSIESLEQFHHCDEFVDEISPERVLSARQEFSLLSQAFNSLSEKCKTVIWLRRVEGLSQRDTAKRLGLNEGAVESQLARGLRALAHAVMGASRTLEGQTNTEVPRGGSYRN
jgi:RNA polymerase sigma factor (sigma-70 family)